jgi:hypothetical protein
MRSPAYGLTQLCGIGDCKTHSMSVRFCGKIGATGGAPTFTLDEASIRVEMEPYPRIKPACNNNFVPLVKDGLAVDAGLFCCPELGDSDFAHLERARTDFAVPKRGITR